MSWLVRIALVLLGLHVSARRSKHAAMGAARTYLHKRSSWFYAGNHSGCRIGDHPASLLIQRLREERAALAA